MKILIVGLGTIAIKHIERLKKLDSSYQFFALRSKKECTNIESVVNLYSYDQLQDYNFKFAIVSSPSFLHEEQIIQLSKLDIPLFVEKPLCISKNQLSQLKKIKTKSLIYIAYNLRFHPLIIYLKNFLKNNTDPVLEVNSYCGSYLPNWRPNKNKNLYSYNKKNGGGVLLDLSHEIDYMIYLFGYPLKSKKYLRKVSDITLDSEDYANLHFIYKDFSVNIILNYFHKDYKEL